MIKERISFSELQAITSSKQLLQLAYGCADISTLTLPINVHDIVKSITNVNFSDELSFDDWDKSGYIKVNREDDSSFKDVDIWINQSEVLPRQRLTLAHEVGHLMLDIIPNIDDDNNCEIFEDKLHRDGAVNIKERKANQFAAKLLMPPELIKREVSKLVAQIKSEERKV